MMTIICGDQCSCSNIMMEFIWRQEQQDGRNIDNRSTEQHMQVNSGKQHNNHEHVRSTRTNMCEAQE
jgi:hypothetical protein